MAVGRAGVAAIINDDESYQEVWSLQVDEAGFKPYIISRPRGRAFGTVNELVDEVEANARFAVLDHRLSLKDFAQFTGAEIVAALYERGLTAPLLVTSFQKIDADTSIRLHRRKVPVLLSLPDFQGPETIRECFDICGKELWEGKLPLARRALRTIVQIEYRTWESDIEVVDALVPGWNPEVRVRFPVDLIAQGIRANAKAGQRFFARVNVGAQRDEDLFFHDFEIACEPDANDGLA